MKPAFADIVVVGAGPVGLVYAHELAKTNSVILLDKNAIPSLHKSWASPLIWLKQAGLEDFCSNIITQAGVYYGGNGHSVKRTLPQEAYIATVDERLLYKRLVPVFEKSGGTVLPLSTIIHYFLTASGIELITSNGIIKAKLMLDCTGIDSPFIKRGDNLKHRFYWNIYGQKFNGHHGEHNLTYLCAYVANYRGMKVYVNDMPEAKQEYTPWMYIMSKNKLDLSILREAYSHALDSAFLQPIIKSYHQQEEKYGWIPAADFKSHASDHILSIGDAGALSPWSTAATFGFMLHKLKLFCDRINDHLVKEQLSEAQLNQIVELSDKEELLFDLSKLLFIILLNIRGSEFAKITSFFAEAPLEMFAEIFGSFEADLPAVLEIVKVLLNHFSVVDLLNIFGRDGFSDELRIGPELLTDIVKYYL